MAKIALFPGTFDPITNGHLDVIERGRGLFDQLIVAIGHNPEKRALFTLDERVEMIRLIAGQSDLDVEVEAYNGLTVDFARQRNANVILRGIRNYSDLQFEFQLAVTNRKAAGIETVWIMAGEEYGYVSSTLIKQVAVAGHVELLESLLPKLVIEQMKLKEDELDAMGFANDAHTQ
ncbi:MAG: pantetheine-phosphate adenylyltransferase [Planctomycetaceae bacterium]|nr:pantetheine-phosphate adenylyltransferase [Planctomycetaceae bacterium]